MIVLDTNQLDRHSLDSPLMALLKILAHSTDHRLALSAITFDEHCAHYEHRLRRAYSQEAKSSNVLHDLLESSGIGRNYGFTLTKNFVKEVSKASSAYKAKLLNIFGLIELDGASAIEALRREAWRIPPASASFDTKGTGARDAAIWLSLIKESARSSETIYFVSSDKRAFKTDQCLVDIDKASVSVVVLADIGELLGVLADDVDAEVDVMLIKESKIVRERFLHYLGGTDVLTNVVHVAIEFPPGSSHTLSYGDSINLEFMGIDDVYGHIIGGTKWVTGRVRWGVFFPLKTEQLRSRTNADAVERKAMWNVSFQVVSSLLFKATADIEAVEILSVGKPSHIAGQLEELRS